MTDDRSTTDIQNKEDYVDNNQQTIAVKDSMHDEEEIKKSPGQSYIFVLIVQNGILSWRAISSQCIRTKVKPSMALERGSAQRRAALIYCHWKK